MLEWLLNIIKPRKREIDLIYKINAIDVSRLKAIYRDQYGGVYINTLSASVVSYSKYLGYIISNLKGKTNPIRDNIISDVERIDLLSFYVHEGMLLDPTNDSKYFIDKCREFILLYESLGDDAYDSSMKRLLYPTYENVTEIITTLYSVHESVYK